MMRRAPAIVLMAVAVYMASCPAFASIVYPQVAIGGGYQTVLAITNSGASPWACRFLVKQRDGQSFPVPLKVNDTPLTDSKLWTIPAQATIQFTFTGDQALRAGYLLIERSDGPSEELIATSVFFRSVDATGRLADLVAIYPAQRMRKALFPVDRSALADTGIALLPIPSANAPGPIRFTLFDQAGAKTQEVELGYSGHFALMSGEIFDLIPATFLGSVAIESPADFYPMALRVEITGQSIQFTGVPPGRGEQTLESPIRRLPFRVLDADYSRAIDRIVAISADPSRIYLLDPVAGSEQHIDLPEPPLSLSISPDGSHAVVGQKTSLWYLDLAPLAVEKQIPTSVEPLEVVLAGNGYVYISYAGQLRCIEISTGVETVSAGDSLIGGVCKVHPNGKSIYCVSSDTVLSKFDISAGTAVGLYWQHTESSSSRVVDLWFLPDGRLVTQSGRVLSTADSWEQDMKTLSRFQTGVRQICLVESAGLLALIPGPITWSDDVRDDEARLYDCQSLQFRLRSRFPSFLADREIMAHGKFVFLNNEATKMFVILQADERSGLFSDYGILTLDRASLEDDAL